MSLIDTDRVVAALEVEWDDTCCGNRNEDACESCRAYANAIRTVQRVREHRAPYAPHCETCTCSGAAPISDED